MAGALDWFRTVSENYSRPILENKKLTLLIWALFLPMMGYNAVGFYKSMVPDEVAPVVTPAVEPKPAPAVKTYDHSSMLNRIGDLEKKVARQDKHLKKFHGY